ncbi:unnamed protein product [Cunninghamella blakesleeana]
MMDHFSNSYEQVRSAETEEHKAKLSHELIAGAAAYEAIKAYNEHCEKNGKPASHAKAKEILGGLAGGLLTKLIETKGLDALDKYKAEQHAKEQLENYYDKELQ